MHPSTDKSKDGVASDILHKTMEEFTTTKIESGLFLGVNLLYYYMRAETSTDVKASLEGISEVVVLQYDTKLFVAFAFSLGDDPLCISKYDMCKLLLCKI